MTPTTTRPDSARVPERRSPEQIADAHQWANRIRQSNPLFGGPTCGDLADLYQSAFRCNDGRPPIHACVLRHMAREQLEAQEAPHPTGSPRASDPAALDPAKSLR
jgi:hypothetical protein